MSYQSVKGFHILKKEDNEKIVMADNGDTIVCWHPENKFPYECSLPLPLNDKISCVNSVLKITEDEYKEAFAFEKPHFQREYLMQVTATTKHRWFPRPKSRKIVYQPDREFL